MKARPAGEVARLFYSYASADERYRQQLEAHLSTLRRARELETWSFRQIHAGDDWRSKIDKNLNSSSIILLLVSASFLNSDYCWDVEMKRALVRHDAGEATVVPVILRDCDWSIAPFAHLQALPEGAKPIQRWRSRDAAWMNVVAGIRLILQRSTAAAPSRELVVSEDLTVADDVIATPGITSDPWKLMMPDEADPKLFAFAASNRYYDGICAVEYHFTRDGRVLLVLTEIVDNPGQSLTNCIEYVARQVAEQFGGEALDFIIVEHFPNDLGDSEWNLVEFDPPATERTAGTPRWRQITEADWALFGVRPRKTRSRLAKMRSVLVSNRRR